MAVAKSKIVRPDAPDCADAEKTGRVEASGGRVER